MSEQTNQRLTALENQAYITYLEYNALIQLLQEKGIIDAESILQKMEAINNDVQEQVKGAEETAAEVVAEEPAV